MSVATVLAAGRRSAEALMTATCKITRIQAVSLDTGTLLLSDLDPSDDLIYQGACRIRSGLARVQSADFEGQLLASQQLMLHVPVLASATIQIGDTVEMIDGGDDPTVVGTRFRIEGLAEQTQATARRMPITLITSTSGS